MNASTKATKSKITKRTPKAAATKPSKPIAAAEPSHTDWWCDSLRSTVQRRTSDQRRELSRLAGALDLLRPGKLGGEDLLTVRGALRRTVTLLLVSTYDIEDAVCEESYRAEIAHMKGVAIARMKGVA